MQATASILVVDPSPTATSYLSYTTSTNEELQFATILRREDIRAYEKDKVVMNEMVRVGDIVRASVISLGDERSYYISTVGNELGVAVAVSEDGNAMLPASWKEMRDVVTGKSEARKVAKPV
jgi:exosome complex component CSL4